MSTSESETSWWFKTDRFAMAALLVAVVAVYARFLFNGYVYDDLYFILENTALHDAGNWFEIFRNGDGFGMAGVNPYYRPITTLTFLLNAITFGNSLIAFHAVNLLFHLATVLVLYFVLKKFSRRSIALAGALLFAVHPAHAEPVGYISARADLICGAFVATAYLLYLRYEEGRSTAVLASSLALLTIGAFAKEVALMLPAALLLQAVMQGKLAERWKPLSACFIAVGFYLAARMMVLGDFGWYDASLYQRVATAGINLSTTVLATFFPVSHKVFYGAEIKKSLLDPDVLSSWLLVGAFVCGAFAMARTRKAASFGIFWYLLMLFPVSGVVMLIYPSFVADRYLYVPLMGLAIAFCDLSELAVSSASWEKHKRTALVMTGLVVAALSLNTALRSDVWRDDYSFWRKASENTPTNTLALSGYAAASMSSVRHEEAEKAFSLALLHGERTPATYSNYALHSAYLGNFDRALDYSRMALSISPMDSFSLANHGVILMLKGDLHEALAYISKSVEINPGNRTANNYLQDVRAMLAGGEE